MIVVAGPPPRKKPRGHTKKVREDKQSIGILGTFYGESQLHFSTSEFRLHNARRHLRSCFSKRPIVAKFRRFSLTTATLNTFMSITYNQPDYIRSTLW
jgi:hypothetical protein